MEDTTTVHSDQLKVITRENETTKKKAEQRTGGQLASPYREYTIVAEIIFCFPSTFP